MARVSIPPHPTNRLRRGLSERNHVYAAFALYEGGVLNKQELIRELRAYQLVGQYLFHTEAALLFLNFIEAKEVML